MRMRRLAATIPMLACSAALAAVGAWSARYLDIAERAGLTGKNVYGGLHRKDYILETTGNGVAIFDYDGDGVDDIFFANGTTLPGQSGESGRPQLYHNDGKGHRTRDLLHPKQAREPGCATVRIINDLQGNQAK